MHMKKGFIQIPLLIGIVALLCTTATAGYFGIKYFDEKQKSQQAEQISTPQSESAAPIEEEKKQVGDVSKSTKKIPQQEAKVAEPVISIQESINLKIEKCKADKQTSYDSSIQKLNATVDKKLQEVFAALQQQYNDAVSKIYSNASIQISAIDPMMTGVQKANLTSQYNYNASQLANEAYNNQQAFWGNQKKEIEASKQQAIDKINVLLNDEYQNCLSS